MFWFFLFIVFAFFVIDYVFFRKSGKVEKLLHPVEIEELAWAEKHERTIAKVLEKSKKEREAFERYCEEVEVSHDWSYQNMRCFICGLGIREYKFEKEYVDKFGMYAPIKCKDSVPAPVPVKKKLDKE